MKNELDWTNEVVDIVHRISRPDKMGEACELINDLLVKYTSIQDNKTFEAGFNDAIDDVLEYVKYRYRRERGKVILEREIVSEPGAAIEVTEITLSPSAREGLNLGKIKL